jgi:hypothetical protein
MHIRGMRETGVCNSAQLGMREAGDLTVSNWIREITGFNSVQLAMREAWDLTVYNWL